MAKQLSERTLAKIEKAMLELGALVRGDEGMAYAITASVKRSGYATSREWAMAKPTDFLKFAEACGAQVDDGHDDQYSPDADAGKRWVG